MLNHKIIENMIDQSIETSLPFSLPQIFREIADKNDSTGILQIIIKSIIDLLDVDEACILSVENGDSSILASCLKNGKTAIHDSNEPFSNNTSIKKNIIEEVLKEKKFIIINNNYAGNLVSHDDKDKQNSECEQILYLPIMNRRSAAWIIYLRKFFSNSQSPFTKYNIEQITLMTSYAYSVFKNIRLKKEIVTTTSGLEQTQKMYSNIINSVADGIIIRNRKGIIETSNPSLSDLFGYTKKEMIGMDASLVVPKENLPDFKNYFAQLKKDKKAMLETIAIKKNGTFFPVSLHGVIFDYNGERSILEIVSDISARKKIEKEIVTAKEEWETTFDAVHEIITIQDTHMRITRANVAASNLLKTDSKNIVGQRCFKIFQGRISPCTGCPVNAAIKSGKAFISEVYHSHSGKTMVENAYPFFNDSGKITGVIHTAKDISLQKKMKQRMRQAQKMESIGTLAGGIAHDFNNILFPIIGYTEMTMALLDKKSAANKNMKKILKASKRAKEMVNQILSFSRQSEPDRKPLKIQPVLREAVAFIRSSIPSTIKISSNIDMDCGYVNVDTTEIHQVVMNLCTNASHAMSAAGGHLKINLSERIIDNNKKNNDVPSGRYLILTVKDTGHGMTNEIREKIFEPYFTSKGPGEGTGMGLSVVHGIINDYGGHIEVKSQPDKGSKFTIYIPVAERNIIQPDADGWKKYGSSTKMPSSAERILLIDDDEQVLETIAAMLEESGYDVTAHAISRDALADFRNNPDKYDLVVTDQTMPDMSGEVLYQELCKIRPNIPVIMCTGFSETFIRQKAEKAGIRAYLVKPVPLREMASTIRQVLDS
ncbi:MAG: PAS domain S-box protein [Desulfosarcina sp.]|nr:PAS domain S-box protein [Desulfobacterales bacterium]